MKLTKIPRLDGLLGFSEIFEWHVIDQVFFLTYSATKLRQFASSCMEMKWQMHKTFGWDWELRFGLTFESLNGTVLYKV